MTIRIFLATVLVLLATACSELTGAASAPFRSTEISGVEWGRDFHLTDHNGQSRRLADFDGKVVMLFFGFSNCPDICPTTMSDLARVVDKLGPGAAQVQVLFVTVDPARDTPQVLQKYVTAFHPGFLGLYGDVQATAALAKEFKFHHAAHPSDAHGAYAVEHGSAVYVYGIDGPNGRRRLLIGPGRTVEAMATDVALLLRQ